jgi:hypothetical protein
VADASANRWRRDVTVQVFITKTVVAVRRATQIQLVLAERPGKRSRTITPEIMNKIRAGSSIGTRLVTAVVNVVLAEGPIETSRQKKKKSSDKQTRKIPQKNSLNPQTNRQNFKKKQKIFRQTDIFFEYLVDIDREIDPFEVAGRIRHSCRCRWRMD